MGRRVGKKKNGVLLKQLIYRDGLKPVAELDGSGALVSEFVYGSKSNVPDYVRRAGATYRVVGDHLGSPRHVVNVANASDVPFTASYASFGEVTGTGLDWMPLGLAGGIYDFDTGLVRFGRRDLDVTTGRWIAKDPIRWGAGRTNLYEYVGNDPINGQDPTGLAVYACQEYQRDFQHWWWIYYGFSHAYVQTDANTFGLYPTDNFGDPTEVRRDYSDLGTQVCQAIPDVDEDCVNEYAMYGSQYGDYGLGNNCGTFVADVLNACQRSAPLEGGEGAPGNYTPYPAGGF
jgi:RHS repeat-associated protein